MWSRIDPKLGVSERRENVIPAPGEPGSETWKDKNNGQIVLLTSLCQGQQATVLQLPVAPRTAEEAEEQKRVAVV
jgi:hypothetical protein